METIQRFHKNRAQSDRLADVQTNGQKVGQTAGKTLFCQASNISSIFESKNVIKIQNPDLKTKNIQKILGPHIYVQYFVVKYL